MLRIAIIRNALINLFMYLHKVCFWAVLLNKNIDVVKAWYHSNKFKNASSCISISLFIKDFMLIFLFIRQNSISNQSTDSSNHTLILLVILGVLTRISPNICLVNQETDHPYLFWHSCRAVLPVWAESEDNWSTPSRQFSRKLSLLNWWINAGEHLVEFTLPSDATVNLAPSFTLLKFSLQG